MYDVHLADQVTGFLDSLDEKGKNICKKNLEKLESPYPGRGIGDKEKLVVDGEEVYRLHIGRTYTAFYIIMEEQKRVLVLELLSIRAAHKKYGY